MTMRIGHTLFGGAVAGLVIASGVAVCAASASAHNQVTRHFESHAYAVSAASGYGLRQANNYPVTAASTAQAYGAPIADYRPLPVEITASATAFGGSTVQYFTYTFANANASMEGAPIRRVKLFPRQAQAVAYAQGDSQSWQLGYAKTAYATAKGFGTTYFVGDGPAHAKATVYGYPALEIGAAGEGFAESETEARAVFTIGLAGFGRASAIAIGDTAVTRDGLREFEANGVGECSAIAVAGTVGIHQSQTGRAFAHIVAYPKVQTGGKGHAKAWATGEADAVGMATGAATVEGETSATATGDAHYQANATSNAAATATTSADGLITETGVIGKVGHGKAAATGRCLRTVQSTSSATAYAATNNSGGLRTVSADQVQAKASAATQSGPVGISINDNYAFAYAAAKAKATRSQFAESHAAAEAQAKGYNQVNDLQKAPERRTHKVAPAVRLTIIGEAQRLIAV